MIETFSHNGVSLKYPANWILELDEDDADWTATLQSPGSAMLLVSFREGEAPADVADQALESLQEDYDELDSEIAVEAISGRPAMGHDIDILTLDTPVTVMTRAIGLESGSVLVMWQFAEAEREHYEPVFAAMISSLSIS